jgi:hypothetical protein
MENPEKPANPIDRARLFFMTYLVMKFEVDRLGDNPGELALVALRTKQDLTLEAAGPSLINDPALCAAMEPLAVAILLGCPDFGRYWSACEMLRRIAITGRFWVSEGGSFSEKEQETNLALETYISAWIDQVEEFLYEKLTLGVGFEPEELHRFFSEEFTAGALAYAEKMNQNGEPNPKELIQQAVSKAVKDYSTDKMMNDVLGSNIPSVDPDDYN